MTLRFEQPELLLLGVLAVPLVIFGYRAMRGMDALRRGTSVTLRALLLLLIVAMLAGPHSVRQHNQLTVIALVDVSGSVQRFGRPPQREGAAAATMTEYLRQWLREAADLRDHDDRFGLVAFDGQAVAVSAPSTAEHVDDGLDMPNLDGTNIAEAIRLGMAMFPGDTARRLILVTDGNQTAGDAVEAARQAAGGGAGAVGVPIDVLPVDYLVQGDVQVVRVETPPTAQPNQTVTARIIIESTHETSGRLTLRREGVPVDLDPQRPGHTRRVAVPAGQSVHVAQVTLGDTPINRFEAVFEPDDPAADALPENNRAEAFTATPSRGSVLIVSNARAETHSLMRMLQRADIPARVQSPQAFPSDLLSLQNYELIILDDIPAYDLTTAQHDLIARYVDQLGGGLIMAGGERGFGAGGWNNTAVAAVLPVDLDPPRELRAPPAGLVLVLDRSGSMNRPVGGARATQQEVANEGAALAIESLSSETYIGVVAFDHLAEPFIHVQRNENPGALAGQVRTIRAMGGTRIQPALQLGYDMLMEVDVQKRHMVLLTDGISSDPDMENFVAQMAERNISITTIGVGDDIDAAQLRMIADGTGGEFYHVRNPRTLPRVLVDSVQEFNKPLLKEGLFDPVVRATGSTMTVGMDDAPQLGGLVITAPRDDPLAALEMIHPDGEPLLAHWQVGLGRVAAFTSDIDGRWSQRWADWAGSQAFWTQLARTIARPAVSRETEMVTVIRDGQLHISLDAVGEQEGFLDYLQVEGTVYGPDQRPTPVRLRQTAPGRYEATVPAASPGSYIVALNPRHGTRQLAPVIGGASRVTSEEFRRYQSNTALLEEIVQITGGRWLDMSQPVAVDVYDRSEMSRSASFLPLWKPLLVWAVVILLLDVASRRIAWSAAMLRNAGAAALAKVTPARVRGQKAAATLSSLRTVSSRIDQQQAARDQGVQKLSATGIIAPPPPRPKQQQAPRRDEPAPAAQKPDRARIGAALDALTGRSAKAKETSQPDSKAKAKSESKTEATDTSDGQSTRSGLLAAKRRAREEFERDRDNR